MILIESKLAEVLALHLSSGSHESFERGLWDAVEAATTGYGSLCWRCSRPQGYFETPCECGAINPNVDLKAALAQQLQP